MTKIVIKDNKFGYLQTDDVELLNKVIKILSFKQDGVEYTPAYKSGWDGWTKLMTPKGKFSLGLLKRICNYLDNSSVTYSVEDSRKAPGENQSLDIAKKLAVLKMKPRDYQLECVEKVSKNNRGIIRAATGAGKTLIAALMTAYLNQPTIIYVISLDILKQFHDLFSAIFDEEIGFIGDGVCNIQRITIATIWSCGSAIKMDKAYLKIEDARKEKYLESNSAKIVDCLKGARVHILDECHIVTAETVSNIYKIIDCERIYGMSGTPYRLDNSELMVESILGDRLVDISPTRLIDAGVLAQPIIKFVNIPTVNGLTNKTYQEVYKEYIVENVVRNKIVLDEVKKLLKKGYFPLVLFKTISHGKKLLEIFQNNGIKCGMIHGDDSLEERESVKNAFVNGDIDLIVGSVVLDIGFDCPKINALVLAGAGKSSVRAIQRIGRSIRSYPGKKHAAVVDFYDQVKFLKKHSKSRKEIYELEPGFKIIENKNM